MVVGIQLRDGSVYFSPNGGYATDGSSIRVTMFADRIWRTIGTVEDYIGKNGTEILKEISNKSGTKTTNAKLELLLDTKQCRVGFKDLKTGTTFGIWVF